MSERFSCPKCGRTYPTDKPWQHKDAFSHLYHDEKMTLPDIAELVDRTTGTLSYWTDKLDLETRSAKESTAYKPPKLHTSNQGYERFAVGLGGRETATIGHHRLIAVAEYGFDAVSDNHVHHKNSIPWDNRPDNLEVLSGSDHLSRHFEQNKDKLFERRRESAKLTKSQVKKIKRKYKSGASQYDLADEFDVNQQHISRIVRGERWKDVEVE